MKKIFSKLDELIEKANRCWDGYKPVAGKKPYSDDSCEPVKKESDPWSAMDRNIPKMDARRARSEAEAKKPKPPKETGGLVFDPPAMPAKEPVKKDDKAHKPGSPEDSAHDAIENDTWDKEEKGRSGKFKQKMGDHARSMIDPKKQRSEDAREAGKDNKGTKEMKKSADTIDRMIEMAEQLEKASQIQGATYDKDTRTTTITYGKKPKVDESKAPVLDYAAMNRPKPQSDANAPTINYSRMSAPKPAVRPVEDEQGLHTRVQSARTPGIIKKGDVDQKVKEVKGPKKLNDVLATVPADKRDDVLRRLREKAKATKLHKTESDEVPMTSEELTTLVKSQMDHSAISGWLGKQHDEGRIHRNVLLEWQNFGTIHPSVYQLIQDSED